MATATDNYVPCRSDLEKHQKNLSERAQQIVDALNVKRKADTQLLTNFKTRLHAQVEKMSQALEQRMYQVYEKQGTIFNEKIQELFQCLERIEKLEEEQEAFKQDMKSFFQEIN